MFSRKYGGLWAVLPNDPARETGVPILTMSGNEAINNGRSYTGVELDSIFPGGSASAELEAWLNRLAKDTGDLQKIATGPGNTEQWRQLIDAVQDIAARLRQAAAFVFCLNAQDVNDDRARLLNGRLQQLEASLNSMMAVLDEKMLEVNDADWRRLLETPELAPVAFSLDERRTNACEKMAAEQETLANDLAVDGYHGWSNQYNLIAGRITIPWMREGRKLALSVGQAFNIFADPDPAARVAMAEKWEQAWSRRPNYARVSQSSQRFQVKPLPAPGWDDILRSPANNRMSAETLQVMWDAVEKNKDIFVNYLERKKKLLGLESCPGSTWTPPRAEPEVYLCPGLPFCGGEPGHSHPQNGRFLRRRLSEALG